MKIVPMIWSLGMLIIYGCGGLSHEATSNPKGVDDISSMQQRYDGLFDVVCKDGRQEVRSDSDIKNNRVCLPPSRTLVSGYYGVESGYGKFCNHRVDPVYVHGKLERVSLTFLDECGNYQVSLICASNFCRTPHRESHRYELMVLYGHRYRFTRFSDGESAVFSKGCRRHQQAC